MSDPRLFDIPEPAPDLTAYDWIVVSSSAGKDSLAMLDYVCEQAEAAGVLPRVVVVHCDLGRVEWPGTRELAEQQAARYGVRFIVVWRRQGDLLSHIEKMGFFPKPDTRYCTSDHKRDQIFRAFTELASETVAARDGDLLEEIEQRGMFPGPTTRFCTAHHKQSPVARVYTALTSQTMAARSGDLLEQVEERGMWPSSQQRYCTSDQKRAQVHRVYTALAATSEEKSGPVRILSCQGMRAEESPARAKRKPLDKDVRASNGKREVTNWLPLHRWKVGEVWERIAASRCADLVHPCYAAGMPRCSCSFCIFASRDALILAGHLRPDLLAEYVRIEKKIGHKFRVNLSMAEVQEAVQAGEKPAAVSDWAM